MEGDVGDACSCNTPVCLPSVQSVGVMLAKVCGLHVKEITEILDCLWQGVSFWHGEDGLEEVIHVRLENALLVHRGTRKGKVRT